MLENKCDIHTHTIASRHAYSTLEENVRAAADRNLEVLGSTDHFSPMIHPGNTVVDWQFFINTICWPQEWYGVKILRGAEVDIVDLHGTLFGEDIALPASLTGCVYSPEKTLFEHCVASQDYAIASVHGTRFCEGASLTETTEMYLKVLENPAVLMLGHIGRSGVSADYNEVILRAQQLGKLIEINNHSLASCHSSDICREIALSCAEYGCQIAVTTDAHVSYHVGCFDNALAMLEEIHFPHDLIATRSAEALNVVMGKFNDSAR